MDLTGVIINNKKVVDCAPMQNFAAFFVLFEDSTVDKVSYAQAKQLLKIIDPN